MDRICQAIGCRMQMTVSDGPARLGARSEENRPSFERFRYVARSSRSDLSPWRISDEILDIRQSRRLYWSSSSRSESSSDYYKITGRNGLEISLLLHISSRILLFVAKLPCTDCLEKDLRSTQKVSQFLIDASYPCLRCQFLVMCSLLRWSR
jgi:hypothetical protein